MIDFRKRPPGWEQGIYNIPFAQYLQIPAVNSSKLKQLRKTPAHFKAYVEAPDEPIPPAKQRMFDIGKAFDTFILEGGEEELKRRVKIEPDMNKNTKVYKEWKEKQPATAIILAKKEYDAVLEMAAACWTKERFAELFSHGTSHLVMVWKDAASGIWCKAEVDWITDDGKLVDLKSTADAGYWFFRRNAMRLGYPNQLAFYLEGLTAVTGIYHQDAYLAAIEKTAPYESHVYRVPQAMLFEATDANHERLARLRNCLDNDTWPGYPDMIMDLDAGLYDEPSYDDDEEDTHGF